MQAAGFDDRVMVLGGGGSVDGVGLVPVFLGGLELLPLIVEAQKAAGSGRIDCAFGGADGARLSFLDQVSFGDEFGVAAEQNVGAAAGHVGGDGDLAVLAGLGDDLRFAFVKLGVEHHVLHAFALQNVRK